VTSYTIKGLLCTVNWRCRVRKWWWPLFILKYHIRDPVEYRTGYLTSTSHKYYCLTCSVKLLKSGIKKIWVQNDPLYVSYKYFELVHCFKSYYVGQTLKWGINMNTNMHWINKYMYSLFGKLYLIRPLGRRDARIILKFILDCKGMNWIELN
jgi:hypothetical protein